MLGSAGEKRNSVSVYQSSCTDEEAMKVSNCKHLRHINIPLNVWLIVSLLISMAAIAFTQASIYGIISVSKVFDGICFILIIAITTFIVVNIKHEFTSRVLILSSCLSFVVALLLVLGMQLESQSAIIWAPSTIAYYIFIFIPLTVSLVLVLRCLTVYQLKQYKIKYPRVYKHRRILVFTVILFFWLMGYLALFPGVYGYDAGFQILQFQDPTIAISSKYSVPYSAFLYFFIWLGESVFNSVTIGFGVYSLIQMVFIVYVCEEICVYLFDRFKSIYLLVISIAFFVLIPYHMVLAVSSCQDVLFSGVFALIIIRAIRLVDDPKEFFSKWYTPVFFSTLLLLLFLLRNNGIYATIIAVPFLLVFIKGNRVKLLTALLAPFVLFEIITGPVYSLVGVEKADATREMLSIPLQQIARVYSYNEDSLTADQVGYLQKLVPDSSWAIYPINPSISDIIKRDLNIDVLEANLPRFFITYLKIGEANPKLYTEAAMMSTLGFWYPTKSYPDYRMYHPLLEYDMFDTVNEPAFSEYIPINRDSLFPQYEYVLSKLVKGNYLTDTRIISIFFTMGTYFILFLTLITFVIYRKAYVYFAPISFFFGLYATIFLGPVALYRYASPIMLCVPLMIAIILLSKNHNKKQLESVKARNHSGM